MSFDNTNIIFLEDSDFQGTTLMYKGKPLTKGKFLIMFQADFCGYCKKAKPMHVECASKLGGLDLNGVIFATVHSDSPNPSETALGKRLGSHLGINGIPAFVLYDASTQQFKMYEGPRTVESIQKFINAN